MSHEKFPSCADESWKKCPAFDDSIIRKIAVSLKANTYFPHSKEAFTAFRMPVQDVKAIIVGMSPYHHTYQAVPNATGIAFGIPDKNRIYEKYPKSLQLIADAVAPDIEDVQGLFDPTFYLWERQGVLMLNIALTCLRNDPTSHIKLWEPFMTKLFEFLSEEYIGMIYYFMGKEAQKYRKQLFEIGNTVLTSAHPAFWARNNKPFEDHKFGEFANAYKLTYGHTFKFIY